MADSANIVVRTEVNGYRNAVVRFSLVSDGSGLAAFKLYDATATGSFGVNKAGATFYPGLHTTLLGFDFEIDGMRGNLLWEATANESILAFGASPEMYDWTSIGGLRVPSGLAGATGSILISTVAAAANATLFGVLHLRKNIP